MNIYLVGNGEFVGYDTYDSVVIAAHDEKEAKAMARSYGGVDYGVIEKVGMTVSYKEPTVILASFNAG